MNSTQASQKQITNDEVCFWENDFDGVSRCIEINPRRYLKKSGSSSRIIEFKKCPGNDYRTIGEELSWDSANEISVKDLTPNLVRMTQPLSQKKKGLDFGKNTKTLRNASGSNLLGEMNIEKLAGKKQGYCSGNLKNLVGQDVKKAKPNMFYSTKENCGVMESNRNLYKKKLQGHKSWGSPNEFPKEILEGYYGKPKTLARNVVSTNRVAINFCDAANSGANNKNPNKSMKI